VRVILLILVIIHLQSLLQSSDICSSYQRLDIVVISDSIFSVFSIGCQLIVIQLSVVRYLLFSYQLLLTSAVIGVWVTIT